MKAKTNDKIATTIIYMVVGFIVLLLISLISYIIYKGRDSLNLGFILGKNKIAETGGGIGPQLFNSFYILVISLIITIPIGVGSGIYLAEYAGNGKIVDFIRLCIETLASLPSIVVGLFGLLVFVILARWKYSILAGALSVSILSIPSMTRVSELAIRNSSKKVKEASLGLGATSWQTIAKLTLPSAMPEILTGIILSAGRILGEAAVFLYTAGMSAPMFEFTRVNLLSTTSTAKLSAFNLFRSAETLSVYIWKLNSEGMVQDASKIANGASAILIIMILVFNFSARFLGNKLYKSYAGK